MLFQGGHDWHDFLQAVKDIAPARSVAISQVTPRAQAGAEVGDKGLGVEAAFLKFEQAHAPGYAVAVAFRAEQEAIRGGSIDADEHRRLRLEDFIEQGRVDGRERLLGRDGTCERHSIPDGIVDAAEGDVAAEAVVEVVDNAAV